MLLKCDKFISKVTTFCYRNVPLSNPFGVSGTTSSPAVAAKYVEKLNKFPWNNRVIVVKTANLKKQMLLWLNGLIH